jgi:hypothetical protein|tara:strand:+ start:2035 stop:2415 length:381 start_codon:yes stop_codon:yes gene_type:complete
MARVDTIQLSGTNYQKVGRLNILNVIVANTFTADITFDLIIGDKTLSETSSSTNAVFVLKDVPIPTGGSLVWDDDGLLTDVFSSGSKINEFNESTKTFTELKDKVFLIRINTSAGTPTASVLMKRK